MSDLVQNIIGGFLAALAMVGLERFGAWTRRPLYLPMSDSA
jgi:hypothetical protein